MEALVIAPDYVTLCIQPRTISEWNHTSSQLGLFSPQIWHTQILTQSLRQHRSGKDEGAEKKNLSSPFQKEKDLSEGGGRMMKMTNMKIFLAESNFTFFSISPFSDKIFSLRTGKRIMFCWLWKHNNVSPFSFLFFFRCCCYFLLRPPQSYHSPRGKCVTALSILICEEAKAKAEKTGQKCSFSMWASHSIISLKSAHTPSPSNEKCLNP